VGNAKHFRGWRRRRGDGGGGRASGCRAEAAKVVSLSSLLSYGAAARPCLRGSSRSPGAPAFEARLPSPPRPRGATAPRVDTWLRGYVVTWLSVVSAATASTPRRRRLPPPPPHRRPAKPRPAAHYSRNFTANLLARRARNKANVDS
jgi:hypothetical protein